MIFTAYHWQLIEDGKKLQTSRIAKKGERLLLDDPYRYRRIMTASGRTKWEEGRSYPVQLQYGTKAVGRVNIAHIGSRLLYQFTDEDAVAEGYERLEDFRHVWREINGKWNPQALAWVLTIAPVTTIATPAMPDIFSDEWRAKHG